MYRFLIADDHYITRRGLQEILADAYPQAEIQTVSNAAELMNSVLKGNWHLVVTDINMPGKSGLEILADLKKEFPKIPVLVISMHPEAQYAVRVIKAGGYGYLCKEEVLDDEIVNAVAQILQGKRYIPPSLAEMLALEVSQVTDKQLHETLSDRELHVFTLLAEGKATGKIAEELSLSVNTIGTFRRRILEKMGMKSNAEIVMYALQHGLLG